MGVDLHIHTLASFGTYAPKEIVRKAAQAGLKTISLTDHESVEGLFEAAAEAECMGIEVIPGVELHTYYQGYEIHLLGYGMDLSEQHFLRRLKELRQQRNDVAKETVLKLQKLGFKLEWEVVQNLSYKDGPISKGHIIKALYNVGYINTRNDILNFMHKYLNRHGLAYVEFSAHSFEEAVELIRAAEGLPVLAHPGLIGNDQLLPELLEYGPWGIEVFYNYYGHMRNEWLNRYYSFAKDNGLIMTAGSDYHGPFGNFQLGDFVAPEGIINRLKEAIRNCKKGI